MRETLKAIRFRRFTETTIVTPEDCWRKSKRYARPAMLTTARSTSRHSLRRRTHYSADRSFVAGVSVTGPAFRVSDEALASWAGIVRDTAAAIMEDMRVRMSPRA